MVDKGKDLVATDPGTLLYLKIAQVPSKEKKAPRESRATRIAKWAKPLTEISKAELAHLEVIMEEFVQSNFAKVWTDRSRLLEQEEIDLLAREYKDIEFIKSALDARYQEFRRMVFTHINVENVDEEYPEMTKGAAVSESEGIAFKREGGNRGAPIIKWDALKKSLSQETWGKLVEKRVIPKQVVEEPSEERLLDLVEEGLIDIESLRPFIEPGAFTPVKFVTRKIK